MTTHGAQHADKHNVTFHVGCSHHEVQALMILVWSMSGTAESGRTCERGSTHTCTCTCEQKCRRTSLYRPSRPAKTGQKEGLTMSTQEARIVPCLGRTDCRGEPRGAAQGMQTFGDILGHVDLESLRLILLSLQALTHDFCQCTVREAQLSSPLRKRYCSSLATRWRSRRAWLITRRPVKQRSDEPPWSLNLWHETGAQGQG
ncbi:hypothetical protein EV126DRAFT_24765 [Verticillium dahliae]|nr:hypothetical protein EV126DRAFT_24765 [Verticillium dahliae]